MEPASIRTKNPGAMWPGPIATKWGSKDFIALNDGTGQGNKIAIFDSWVEGICAQLDLWRTSPRYRNKRFADAIAVWSGGNQVESYIKYVTTRVPGMTRDTVMNDEFWKGPQGLGFLKAQAGHEAGKKYPAPDEDWVEAQRRVFETVPLAPSPAEQPGGDPPWLVKARELVGLKEIVGSQHEPKVLEFFKEAGHPEVHDDETAWCAAFANAMLRRSGYAGTGSLAARSFLTWGSTLESPRLGCIAVFKRGNSEWQGHVAFFLREVGNRIEILGGNQGNAVSITTMPKDALLGYRWPSITSAPATETKPGKETAKAGGAVAGGAVVMAGAKEAVDAGWGVFEWSMLIGGLVLLVALGWAAYRYGWPAFKAWREKPKDEKAEPIVPALPPERKRKAATKTPAPKKRAPRKPAAKPKGKKKSTKRKAA